MHKDLIIYIDFDSTLYNTPVFSRRLRQLISDKVSLPHEQVENDGKEHYFHPYLGGYEYENHIKRYGLDPETMWKALDTITDDHTYLYEDSAWFIQTLRERNYEPKILTFGEERFQIAKIKQMLPYLSSKAFPSPLDIIVVDKKKNQHISALHAGQRGVLIDDKPNQELPDGFTEIHLDRSANIKQPDLNNGTVTVSNFQQAADIIAALKA